MSKYVIETKNLTKQYGTQKSVADLNIHVRQGRIYGLLGRNGAGKTTTMKMLLVAGDQYCFPPFRTEVTDKRAHFRNSNRIKTVNRFVQNQKLRVVHNGKGNRQSLLHAKGVLGKQLFVFIGKPH